MSSRPPLGAANVKRRRRGDKPHRHKKPCLLKSGGRKNRPLPYDLLEAMGLLYLPICYMYINKMPTNWCGRQNATPLKFDQKQSEAAFSPVLRTSTNADRKKLVTSYPVWL